MNLEQRWMDLCYRLNTINGDVVWEWLYASYTEEHRHYHTLSHIESCLSILDQYLAVHPEDEIYRDQLEYAFWFHDSIYDTKSSQNEEDSVWCARAAASTFLHLENFPLDSVCNLIMQTKHASPVETSHLEDIFLDIDLSILGAEPDVFDQYHQDIRKEYSWVPEEIYQFKRLEILEQFKDRNPIFKTQFMRDKYETQAKENLMRSILVSEEIKVDLV